MYLEVHGEYGIDHQFCAIYHRDRTLHPISTYLASGLAVDLKKEVELMEENNESEMTPSQKRRQTIERMAREQKAREEQESKGGTG